MTDAPAKPQPSSQQQMPRAANMQIGAICPADFGLKVAYWTKQPGDPVTFRDILGWAPVPNFVEAQTPPFLPVVLNDHGWPVIAGHVPNAVGHFKKDASEEDVRAQVLNAGPSPTPGPMGGSPN